MTGKTDAGHERSGECDTTEDRAVDGGQVWRQNKEKVTNSAGRDIQSCRAKEDKIRTRGR